MQILEKILLATDFTEYNENAIQSAIALAKTFDSRIIPLHVLPADLDNEKATQLLDKAADRELNKLKKRINDEGVGTEGPILEHGDLLDRIIRVSENTDANMILIGAGSNMEDELYKLGVTARKIIQKSDKPVMVIQTGEYMDINKVICPVDFSDESKRALENAMIMARRFNAELLILHAFDRPYRGPLEKLIDWDDQNQSLMAKHKKNFTKFLKGMSFGDLKVTQQIKQGDFAKIILETIKKEKIDFMVLGSSGVTGISKFLIGNITERVIREVPCSFVTMKYENIIELKLNAQVRDIETHSKNAEQLIKDGLYNSALNEYFICLKINEMHIPSMKGIAEVYEILGDMKNAEKYRQLAKDIMARIWDSKIEAEVRKFYRK